MSVLITKTLQNVAAPLILGDISENSYLTNGQIFALPLLHLKIVRLTSNSSLELRPLFKIHKDVFLCNSASLIQSNLSNTDTEVTEQSVCIREVSIV